MGKVQKELLGFFLEEASEHLSVLENGLLRLEKDPGDFSLLDELFRSAHTIKGSAALVKLTATSKIAHRLEDTLESIRDSHVSPSAETIDAMLFALDRIKDLVGIVTDGDDEPAGVLEQVEQAFAVAQADSEEDLAGLAEAHVSEPGGASQDQDSERPWPAAASGEVEEALPSEEPLVAEEVPEEQVVTEEQLAEAVSVDDKGGSMESQFLSAEPLSQASERDGEKGVTAKEEGELETRAAETPPDVAAMDAAAKQQGFQKERRTPGRRLDDVDLASGGVIKIESKKLDTMMNVLGEITITKNHLMDQLTAIENLRDEVDFAGQRLIREVSTFSDRYAYSLPEQVKYKDDLLSEFMDLEFDRYDELNLFSRKLQEITNDVNEGLRSLNDFFTTFMQNVGSIDRLIGDMKERISDARMIEAGTLFQRFTRTVRDLTRQTGKQIKFMVAGGETPLDRVVYDGLFDPLLHIIRNAVAHGFESADERSAAGKPDVGTIRLSARREGNTIVIEVRDDGRGIQFGKIRQRAVERGLLDSEEKVPPQELLKFLFMPGFSTADTADQTSGRGVGLDVVKDRLALLNGTVSILTKKGRGTIFRLRLPVSLVIINVVQFRVGRQAFVVPSNLVGEIAGFPASEFTGGDEIHIRDHYLPAIDLNTVFGFPVKSDVNQRFAIVTLVSGGRVALIVDEIVSQEDTIIKPFGSFLKELRFYSGTSVAGDGSLRPVINPSWIVEGRKPEHVEEMVVEAVQEPAPFSPDNKGGGVVMVVDDSLSVRKIASMLLENNGYTVKTATHGLEALDLLEEEGANVDFILTDLEMPVMHGYELLGELNRRGMLENIPVVVLTSRGGDAHRQKAFNLGASDYLVKPFEEETLVGMVRKYIHRHQDV